MAIAEKRTIEFFGKGLKPFLKNKTLHQVYSFIFKFITYIRTTVMKVNYMRRGILQPSLSLLMDSLLIDVESSILYTVGLQLWGTQLGDAIRPFHWRATQKTAVSSFLKVMKSCYALSLFSDVTPQEFLCNSRWHVPLLNPLLLAIGVWLSVCKWGLSLCLWASLTSPEQKEI